MIVCPVVVGGGKRFFPDGVRLDLKLVEEWRFHNGVLVRHPGKATVKLEYISKGMPKGSTISNGATVKLYVNDKLAAEGETRKAMFRHGVEPFEIGRDSISPANADYKAKMPYAFTGTINKITFEATPPKK